MHAYLFGDLFIENQGLEKPGRREETEKRLFFLCCPHNITIPKVQEKFGRL